MKKILVVFVSLILVFLLTVLSIYIFKIRTNGQPKKYSQISYNSSLKLDSKYASFKNNAELFAIIPGLREKIVPQGITYSAKNNIIILSGYHCGNASSVLFFLDFESGNLIKSLILTMDNDSNFTGHVGGVTTNDDRLWIVGDYKIYEYSLDDLLNKNDMDKVKYDKMYNTFTKADYITYHDGILWVGEYNYKQIYQTKKENTIVTPNNNINKSLLSGYILDTNNEFYVPDYLISIPDRIQGLTFDQNNNFIFSRSFWSFQSSNITIYKNVLNEEWDDTFEINGELVPLTYFDETNYISNTVIPPMSEEIIYIDNELYILFESYSNLYKYYTRNRIEYIIKLK